MKSFSVHRNLTINLIALIASLAAGVSVARAQYYSLRDLGVLPGQTESTSAMINNRGLVTGTSGTSAFCYNGLNKQPMEDVGRIPLGSISHGFGMNVSGQVVGDSSFGAAQFLNHRAALFSNGTASDLGTLAQGDLSSATGINAFSQVVGVSGPRADGKLGRAFIWSPSTRMIDLGTLGGAYAQALAINDSGAVTGNAQIASASIGLYPLTHAFVWQVKTGMVDLGTIAGDSSYGTCLNANGHIVGYSTVNKVDSRMHAFLHDGTTMLNLGSLGGTSENTDQSFALGVNAADQVVGYTYLPQTLGRVSGSVSDPIHPPQPVAFVYQNGQMLDLNTRIILPGSNYRLFSATAINDNGQIVATAFNESANNFHAVLLTPITSSNPLSTGKR
jgi:probable HAF family extracellular repeat protein